MINNFYLIILIVIISSSLFYYRRFIKVKINWFLYSTLYFFNKFKTSQILVNQINYKVYNYNLFNSFKIIKNNDYILYQYFKDQFIKIDKISTKIINDKDTNDESLIKIINIENFNYLKTPLQLNLSYFKYTSTIISKLRKKNFIIEEIEFVIMKLNIKFKIIHIYKFNKDSYNYGVICLPGSSSNYQNMIDKSLIDYGQNFPLKFVEKNFSVIIPIMPSQINLLNSLDLLLREKNLTMLGFYQIINIISYRFFLNELNIKNIGFAGISVGSHIPLITISLLKNVDFYYSSCGLKDLHEDLFIENISKNPLNFLIYGFYEVFKKFNYISIFSSIFKGKIIIDIGIDDKVTKNWKKIIEIILKSRNFKNILFFIHKGGHQFSNSVVLEKAIKFIKKNEK